MKTITTILASLALASLTMFAASVPTFGPTSFSDYDTNSDGVISSEEFNTVKAKKMAAKAEEGRLMKNANNSPQFEDIDANKDGSITKDELQTFQINRMKERKNMMNGQGMGMGQTLK